MRVDPVIQRMVVHCVTMPMRMPFGHAQATRRVAENIVAPLELDGVEGAGEAVDVIRRMAEDRIPQKSALVPEDVVPTVLFLASDRAARINGQSINVCGGTVMS